MDLQQIRRDLRARLSVYGAQWSMTVRPSHVLALLDALDAAETQVQRVRALHFGEYVDHGPRLRRTRCYKYVEDEDLNRCYECGDDWPCATIRAIDDVMCPTCGEPHPCLTERAIDMEVES